MYPPRSLARCLRCFRVVVVISVLLGLGATFARAQSADVVIYGATPAGIAAAIAAAKGGRSVLLAEPTIRIGGMTTNGLSHPDFRAFEAITGSYYDLTQRSLAYYAKTYGADSPQVKDCFRGTHAEPRVNLLLFQQIDQNDPSVPEAFRAEARKWGWCRDEFVESGHIPPQLYVREARRMVGLRIFTQHDTPPAPGDARAKLHRDSIAIGGYGHSSHGTRHEGSRFGGKRYGEGLGVAYAPYQIPYGTIVPKDVRNLLVPVAASASHVGFCALRLEPIWTSLGQAAGHAARLALQQGAPPDVRTVTVAQLQRRLHADASATIYVNDVLPRHSDFAAVQWWGTAGGLHGLASQPKGSRLGKQIQGQHSEGWLNHTADLARVLNAPLAARWQALARELGLPVEKLPQTDARTTRGDWIRAAFRLSGGG